MSFPIEKKENCFVLRDRSNTNFNDDIKFVVNYFGFESNQFDLPNKHDNRLNYSYEIIAAFVNKEQNKFAFVICEDDNNCGNSDVHYYLKAYDNGYVVVDWELESYNPYFGCSVYYLEWIHNSIVLIYNEKHSTNCVSIDPIDCPPIDCLTVTTNDIPFDKTSIGSQPNKFMRNRKYNIYKKIRIRPVGSDFEIDNSGSTNRLTFYVKRRIELPSLNIAMYDDSKEFFEDSEHIPYYRKKYD